jgi:hypothetical protein
MALSEALPEVAAFTPYARLLVNLTPEMGFSSRDRPQLNDVF